MNLLNFFVRRQFSVTYILNGNVKSIKVEYADEPSKETARILVANKLEVNPTSITVISIVSA